MSLIPSTASNNDQPNRHSLTWRMTRIPPQRGQSIKELVLDKTSSAPPYCSIPATNGFNLLANFRDVWSLLASSASWASFRTCSARVVAVKISFSSVASESKNRFETLLNGSLGSLLPEPPLRPWSAWILGFIFLLR